MACSCEKTSWTDDNRAAFTNRHFCNRTAVRSSIQETHRERQRTRTGPDRGLFCLNSVPLLGAWDDQLGDPPPPPPACLPWWLPEGLVDGPTPIAASRNRARLELGMSTVIGVGPATCTSWDCNWATNACNLCTSDNVSGAGGGFQSLGTFLDAGNDRGSLGLDCLRMCSSSDQKLFAISHLCLDRWSLSCLLGTFQSFPVGVDLGTVDPLHGCQCSLQLDHPLLGV